jgi:hypothetical protein
MSDNLADYAIPNTNTSIQVQEIDRILMQLTASTIMLKAKVVSGTLTEHDKVQAREIKENIETLLSQKRDLGW